MSGEIILPMMVHFYFYGAHLASKLVGWLVHEESRMHSNEAVIPTYPRYHSLFKP